MKASWIKYLIAGIILTGLIIFLAPVIFNGFVNTIPSSGQTPISTVSPEPIATSHPVQTTNLEVQPLVPVLENTKEIIRQFTNTSVTEIHYVGKSTDLVSINNTVYGIDNHTGRVRVMSPSFGFVSRSKGQNDSISLDQGYVIAELFAREKYPEFWNVSDTRGIENSIKRVEYSRSMMYGWNEIYYVPDKNTPNHTDVQGLNSIVVSVDSFTGQIVEYSEVYTPSVISGIAPVNLTPVLTEEQAQKIAEEHFPGGRVPVKFTKLLITTGDDSTPHLAWSMDVTNTPPPGPNEEEKFDYKA